MCHCSTCRGECSQTVRTCQRHMSLYGAYQDADVVSGETDNEVTKRKTLLYVLF